MSAKLWGGRFSKDTNASIIQWTESVSIDSKMVVEDIWGSLAHVTMLGRQGIIPISDTVAILSTLLRFQDEYSAGKWQLCLEHEDVHMNVEARLIDTLGIDVGGKMHTCRSRNDQVPLDSKLYTRNQLLDIRQNLIAAADAFLKRARLHINDVTIGYTHVQHAQPISIAFWLSHYVAIFLRDLERLEHAYNVTDENPLGAGAIAGTSFPIDRRLSTELLGFQKVQLHALDATSSRDFMLEVLSAVSIMMTTLSRFSEEMIVWSSYEFGTVTFDDGFAMGSSMMPQKKNPGSLELLRGRSGRMNGLMAAGLTMMKGLFSGYNRDFHEEKEILWQALELANRSTAFLPTFIESVTFNQERMRALSQSNFAQATELANHLVRDHKLPFRQAHHVVGKLVGALVKKGTSLVDTEGCLQNLKEQGITITHTDLKRVLDPAYIVSTYNSLGGTGQQSTQSMLDEFSSDLAAKKSTLEADQQRVQNAFEWTRRIARGASDVRSIAELDRLIQTCRQ